MFSFGIQLGNYLRLSALATLLRYVSVSGSRVQTETFIEIVETLSEQGVPDMSTIAEELIELGKQQGLEQGKQQGMLTTLRLFLSRRFNIPLDHFDAQLTQLSLDDLTTLADEAFAADTLSAFETKLHTVIPPSTSQNH